MMKVLRHPHGASARLTTAAALIALLAPIGFLPTPGSAAPAAPAAAPAPASAPAARAAGEVGLLTAATPKRKVKRTKGRPVETGMRFTPKVSGKVTGVRYYKAWKRRSGTPARGSLWNAKGKRLATVSISRWKGTGWRSVKFSRPVAVKKGNRYTVSVFSASGRRSVTRKFFNKPIERAKLRAPGKINGAMRKGSSSAFPNRAAGGDSNYWVDVRFVAAKPSTSSSSWPNAANTGAPGAAKLTPYNGPCTITSTRTIEFVDATSRCDALLIRAPNVVIRKSLVPRIDATDGGSASVTVERSTVLGRDWVDGAIWGYNITAKKVEVTGGQHSFHCASNCTLTDSWLHSQYNPDGEGFHNNAFLSNGGTDMVIRHNTLHCSAILNNTDGGCTADLSLFGDFDPISRVTVDNNLFKANSSSISYCAYGGYQPTKAHPVATHIVFTDNVFERGSNNKCGVYGAVTSFQTGATGNVWSGNRWNDGKTLKP